MSYPIIFTDKDVKNEPPSERPEYDKEECDRYRALCVENGIGELIKNNKLNKKARRKIKRVGAWDPPIGYFQYLVDRKRRLEDAGHACEALEMEQVQSVTYVRKVKEE